MLSMFNNNYATLSYFEQYMGEITLDMLEDGLYPGGEAKPSSLRVNDLPPRDTLREVVAEDPNTVRRRALLLYMGSK